MPESQLHDDRLRFARQDLDRICVQFFLFRELRELFRHVLSKVFGGGKRLKQLFNGAGVLRKGIPLCADGDAEGEKASKGFVVGKNRRIDAVKGRRIDLSFRLNADEAASLEKRTQRLHRSMHFFVPNESGF